MWIQTKNEKLVNLENYDGVRILDYNCDQFAIVAYRRQEVGDLRWYEELLGGYPKGMAREVLADMAWKMNEGEKFYQMP